MHTGQHRRRWPHIKQKLGQCRLVIAASGIKQYQPSKHEALNQCWFDPGEGSQTVGQHWASIWSTSCLLGVLINVWHQNGIINSAKYIDSSVHRSYLIT